MNDLHQTSFQKTAWEFRTAIRVKWKRKCCVVASTTRLLRSRSVVATEYVTVRREQRECHVSLAFDFLEQTVVSEFFDSAIVDNVGIGQTSLFLSVSDFATVSVFE